MILLPVALAEPFTFAIPLATIDLFLGFVVFGSSKVMFLSKEFETLMYFHRVFMINMQTQSESRDRYQLCQPVQ